ncbi:MAG: hypothetical protein EBU46_04750 [Nitrosomonadaceae bacterium]|nr:hypothetical protein [Nitrosomonadaceae bacterium]
MTKSLTKKKPAAKPKAAVKKTPKKPKATSTQPELIAPAAPGKIAELVDINRLPFEKQAALILNTFPGEKLGIVIKARTDKGLHDAHLPKLFVPKAQR